MVLSKSFSICLDVIRWSFEEALTICKKMKVLLDNFLHFLIFFHIIKKQSLSIYSKIARKDMFDFGSVFLFATRFFIHINQKKIL